MFRPRLFPRYSDALKQTFESGQRFRAQAQPHGARGAEGRGANGGGADGGGADRVGADRGGEWEGGENRSQDLENSRDAAVNQLNREAYNLAAATKDRMIKDEKRRKAMKQKVDLEKRRKQFGSGNVVTFLLDVNRGAKPRDIYAMEISKLLVHGGFKKEDVIGIKKSEWCSYQIEVHLNEGVLFDCEEIERKIRGQAKLGYSVSKFAYSEDIIKISGIPFHKDSDLVKRLIKEAIGPFVQDVLLIEQGRYYEDKMDFFHGKYNGEWKVKVVARVGALIPTFIIIGKTSKLVAQVNYVKISSDMEQEEICFDCFKPGHKKFSEQCEGPIQVMEFAEEFEQIWKLNMEAKSDTDGGNLEESVVIDESKTGGSMKKLEEELQAQRQACKDKEGLLVANRQELESLRKEMQGCKEKEGLLVSSSQEVESLRKEMLEIQRNKNVDEGGKIEDLEFAISDLEKMIEEMQGAKERSEKENLEVVENLRTMHRLAFEDNKILLAKSDDMEKKTESLLIERDDLLGKVEKMSTELMTLKVVEELLDEVEIMAKTVEAVSRVSNGEEGVRNGRVSKTPSVASMELSFLGEEGEVNDFIEENSEEEEGVEEVFTNEEIVLEILEKNEANMEVTEKNEVNDEVIDNVNVNEGVTEGTKENSDENVEEVVEIDLDTGDGVVVTRGVMDTDDKDGSIFSELRGGKTKGTGDGVVVTGGVVTGGVMDTDDKDGSIFNELRGGKTKGAIKKKRKVGQEDESPGVGKKVKVRYPKENACIQYLRDGLWVTATVTKKVHKSKELRWFNVRHMNTDLVDCCVDLGIQEYWRYPEEDHDLENISSLRSDTFDYGAPLVVKGIKSSSPVGENRVCDKLMEENIEAFANISSIAGEEEIISME